MRTVLSSNEDHLTNLILRFVLFCAYLGKSGLLQRYRDSPMIPSRSFLVAHAQLNTHYVLPSMCSCFV